MPTVQTKREREKRMVTQMIALYCRRNHRTRGALCPDCASLADYARSRSERCPFMETKTFCANCRVHCYKPAMREKIRAVMRFSGPRMLFHHPVAAVWHVIEAKREKTGIRISPQKPFFALKSRKAANMASIRKIVHTTANDPTCESFKIFCRVAKSRRDKIASQQSMKPSR